MALGIGAADRVFEVVVVSSSSKQPNQPGVLHVDVEVVALLFLLVVVVVVLVVLSSSSKQPNQPGVLQVSVLVFVVV